MSVKKAKTVSAIPVEPQRIIHRGETYWRHDIYHSKASAQRAIGRLPPSSEPILVKFDPHVEGEPDWGVYTRNAFL